jgi:hypothetical protein
VMLLNALTGFAADSTQALCEGVSLLQFVKAKIKTGVQLVVSGYALVSRTSYVRQRFVCGHQICTKLSNWNSVIENIRGLQHVALYPSGRAKERRTILDIAAGSLRQSARAKSKDNKKRNECGFHALSLAARRELINNIVRVNSGNGLVRL